MGKGPLVSQLPKPVVTDGGKQQQRPPDVTVVSILTDDEYASAVIAVVSRVEDDSEGNANMQGLSYALRRLLLSRYDPPLPLYWTLVTVEKSLWLDRTRKDPLEFGTSILNFAGKALRSLKTLSAVNASGQTALSSIAPIVGLLYDVACLLSSIVGSLNQNQQNTGNAGGNGKRVRKLVRKLKVLIQDLISFTSLCHCKDLKNFGRSFSLPPAPEISLENFPDFLYPPLPLASKKAKSLSRELSNSAVCADIVSGEVVLLQLIVETLDRRILLKKQNIDFIVGQDEFVQRLKNLSVHSVWAASSPSPSEMLLDLLREKRLPVLDLLASKEEILVKGVLFEVILIDAPLFSLFGEAGGESNSSPSGLDRTSVVFMKKLSIARRAITFFRSQQERSRLASLLTQIRAWHFPPRLSKWLKSQKKQRLPVIALQDQQALINWLVNTAEKSVFTAILEKSVTTWSIGLTPVGTAKHVEVVEVENGEAHSDKEGEDLFFVDKAGETELASIDSSSADLDFTVAAQAMKGESDKMKKKKKKQSKVLYHRRERSSAGMQRSRIEVDDVLITSSSGSDSEDSEENRTKSAKNKLKSIKHKAVDMRASSEEGEDDDNDGALASVQLSREDISLVVKSGDFSNQKQAEHHPAQRTEEHSVGVVSEELKGGVGAEGLLSQPDRETVITSVSASEVDVRSSSTTSQVAPVLLTEGLSAKKKKKSKDPADADREVSADLCPPQRTEELTGGILCNELTSGVGAEELLSQPAKETVISSVSVNAVDIRQSSTMSQVEPVPLSVGKSAKKKKKRLEDPGDPDVEAPTERNPPQRAEELAGGMGTEEVAGGVGRAGTEELLSQPNEEVLITSVSGNEVGSRDSLTVSQVVPVSLSVEKSAKKKKKKSKDPGDRDMQALGEQRAEKIAGGVGTEEPTGGVGTDELAGGAGNDELAGGAGTEELTGGAGTEELLSQPNMEMVLISVSATEVDSRDSLTTSQVDVVPLSVRKSDKKKMKKSKDPGDPYMEALGELNPPQRTEKLAGGVGTDELNARADFQGEEVVDLAQKGATTSCEELQTRRSSSTLSIPTPQNEGSDGLAVLEDVTGVMQNPSLKNIQEEIPVVKSSRKKRMKEHPGEEDESNQHQIFDTIKEELVTASAKVFSGADLIDALQVEESLPVNQQLSSKSKTTRSKRARLGEEGNSTGDIAGTTTRESALTISALNSDKARIANETTQDGIGPQGDVATTEEEALLSASLTKEILGNPQNQEGQPHNESGQNVPLPVGIQVSPPNDAVENMELVPQRMPLKKNNDGTGTPRSRRKRPKSQTDVGLPAVGEDTTQPKEEVCEEAPIASPAQMQERGQGQEERELKTPDAVVQVLDVDIVTSAKPSSRKRGKPEIFQLSGGSDTTDEMLYQRRTRSGRVLGTPPPTPTRKANMRRKLVLEPLEEEK